MSDEISRISELTNADQIKENGVIPLVNNPEENTLKVDVTTLRSALFFEHAFVDIAAGLNETEKGESFFVFEDVSKKTVLGWVNQGGGTYSALIEQDGTQAKHITGKRMLDLSSLYENILLEGGEDIHVKVVSDAISRTLNSSLTDNGVCVTAFGADPTGNKPCDGAFEAALLYSKTIRLPCDGIFLITRPITFYPQSALVSPNAQSGYNDSRRAVIYAKKPVAGDTTTWQGGSNTSLLKPSAASTQSFTIQNITLQGWASVDYANLAGAEDINVNGLDIAGCKDVIKLIDVSFKYLSKAICSSNDTTSYTDTVMCNNVHINRCFQAIDALPTVGFIINGLHIYDCYKWINTSRLSGNGLVCNNSSFATENTQIKADSISVDGVWIEGGNNVINAASCLFATGYISETFSATGSTKFIIDTRFSGTNADSQHIVLKGVRMPTNTRLVNGGLGSQNYRNLSITLEGCSNVGGSFGTSSDIYGYVSRGLRYNGACNALRAAETTDKWNRRYNVSSQGIQLNRVSGTVVTSAGVSISVAFDPAFLSSQNATTQPEVLKLNYVGHNDGTGGNAAFYTEITLIKGMGNVWSVLNTTPAVATVGIVPSSTGTGVTLTVTPAHEGNKNNGGIWISFCSANLQLTL